VAGAQEQPLAVGPLPAQQSAHRPGVLFEFGGVAGAEGPVPVQGAEGAAVPGAAEGRLEHDAEVAVRRQDRGWVGIRRPVGLRLAGNVVPGPPQDLVVEPAVQFGRRAGPCLGRQPVGFFHHGTGLVAGHGPPPADVRRPRSLSPHIEPGGQVPAVGEAPAEIREQPPLAVEGDHAVAVGADDGAVGPQCDQQWGGHLAAIVSLARGPHDGPAGRYPTTSRNTRTKLSSSRASTASSLQPRRFRAATRSGIRPWSSRPLTAAKGGSRFRSAGLRYWNSRSEKSRPSPTCSPPARLRTYSIWATKSSRSASKSLTRPLTQFRPMTPPRSATARICRSVTLRRVGQRARALEWERMTGPLVRSRTSQNPPSLRWLRSIRIRSRWARSMTASPKAVRPRLSRGSSMP